MRINLKKMKRSIISFLEYRENLETTSFIIFDYFIHMPSREIKLRELLIIYSTFNFQSKFLSSQCLIIRDENKVWYKKKFITGLCIDIAGGNTVYYNLLILLSCKINSILLSISTIVYYFLNLFL